MAYFSNLYSSNVRVAVVSAVLIALICASPTLADGATVDIPAFPKLNFTIDNVVVLPPGDFDGVVTKADGVTPHQKTEIALLNPDDGEELFSTITDEEGRFNFEGVPEGRYVVRTGNPGIVAILDVAGGANPGALNVVVPKAQTLPVPEWAPEWFERSPALGYLLIGGGGAAVAGGGYYWYRASRRRRDVSPIMP